MRGLDNSPVQLVRRGRHPDPPGGRGTQASVSVSVVDCVPGHQRGAPGAERMVRVAAGSRRVCVSVIGLGGFLRLNTPMLFVV